jgi:hypothetical protein
MLKKLKDMSVDNNTMDSLYNEVNEIIDEKGVKFVCEHLNVANGTVKRWMNLKRVPRHYELDIARMRGKDIDVSKFTTKEKDQFFTPVETAKYCHGIFKKIIKDNKEKEKGCSS